MREAPDAVTIDEARTWPNERLLSARDAALVQERRWQQRRILVDRVLDERGVTGSEAAEWVQRRDKVSSHTARSEVEVARALESLPAIRAAAEAGELSIEQLESVVQLATSETDAEWAKRAPHTAPTELHRLVRKQRVVTPEEMEARRRAREFRWWRTRGGNGLRLSGELFDVAAALVEQVLEHEIETMKPARARGCGGDTDDPAASGASRRSSPCSLAWGSVGSSTRV